MKNRKYYILFAAIFFSVALLLLILSFNKQRYTSEDAAISYEYSIPEFDIYGIEIGPYKIEDGIVQNRQTLGQILSGFELPYMIVDDVVRKMSDWFDPRRIRAGNNFIAYYDEVINEADTVKDLRYFAYDITKLEFVLVCFYDSVEVVRGIKEVTDVPSKASGIINSSLWETLINNDLHPELAIKMSEILAWSVDFHRIHAGDRFKVVYNEQFIGDERVGVGSVDAIYFLHQRREVYGFHFASDTIDGFFDPEGDNLRKVFLRAPLKFGRISSSFSHSRLHPIHNVRRPHYGTDYAAPEGTPILAVGDGVVTQARFRGGNGNYVRIRHNSVYETQYLHMSRFARGMRPGRRVKQGEVIGYVGMTGDATGPHVCFRFWKNGQQVDHLREEFPSADPLPEVYYDEFFIVRDSLMEVLNTIHFMEEELGS